MNTEIQRIGKHLEFFLKQINRDDYSKNLPLILNASIGEHTRHILNFIENLLKGLQTGEICYDKRKRDTGIESEPERALELLFQIFSLIQKQDLNQNIELKLVVKRDKDLFIKTNFSRELVYVLEHSIHHMAIIQIAIKTHFPEIQLPKEFGFAPSTIQYKYKNIKK
ncbi:MAG: hypothetical protein H7A25_08440 [Leptospiraceae bacterium]|nr:hypothetical protein [Leptospiraceae bacterium]MCP5499916.1 hypothetical protein [Leptospiraceae bacterium]